MLWARLIFRGCDPNRPIS